MNGLAEYLVADMSIDGEVPGAVFASIRDLGEKYPIYTPSCILHVEHDGEWTPTWGFCIEENGVSFMLSHDEFCFVPQDEIIMAEFLRQQP